ncbi:VOC family protein [Streptomyces sp. NPDC059893]|uniref:VOC family protein n=1 Tax=Streptomyces sp. NPDC059893 TaxID=3346990 RepID=UPI00365160D1
MTCSERAFRVRMLYHPVIHVPSLEEAEAFYTRVFGRPSTNFRAVMPNPPAPGHSVGYSTFTAISDVLIDNLAPKQYLTGGVQRYPDVDTPRLTTTGWYVEGVKDLYKALRAHGFRLLDVRDQVLEDDEWAGGPSPFVSLKGDAGLAYRFFEMYPFPLDPRVTEGWTVPPVTDEDPLGIVRAAHHTVLTARPERALKLTVDVLGGEVIHTGRDELRGVYGPYVRLADAVFHFATPHPCGARSADVPGDGDGAPDTYHAITWQVADLERAAKHLEAQGVRIAQRSETALVTDPATSLGVPWGFTATSIDIEGDSR